jgi:hypothetical protein
MPAIDPAPRRGRPEKPPQERVRNCGLAGYPAEVEAIEDATSQMGFRSRMDLVRYALRRIRLPASIRRRIRAPQYRSR